MYNFDTYVNATKRSIIVFKSKSFLCNL